MAKIKLKKKKTVNPQPTDNLYLFANDNIDVVDVNYTLSTDEEEITDLQWLRLLKAIFKIDDRTFREGLKRIDENNVFANLDQETKDELAKRFATDISNVMTVYPNFWDRVMNGYREFHSPQVQARSQRFKWCAALIYNAVLPAGAGVIIGKMISNGFHTTYVDFGTESLADDGVEGLFDYVQSTTGTSFANAGLLEDATGNMITGTITETELVTRIMDCLKLGIMYNPNNV